MTKWPPPDATKAEVDAFYRAQEEASAPQMSIPTGPCSACGHQHAGAELAGICIGCPCPGASGDPGAPMGGVP